MILILSTNKEYTTDKVVDWLYAYEAKFVRFNDNDITEQEGKSDYHFTITGESNNHHICNSDGNIIDLDEVKVVWLRKFGFYHETTWYKKLSTTQSEDVIIGLKAEYFALLRLLVKLLEGKKWLTPYWLARPNKYHVLSQARKVGLNIPASSIVNRKEQLMRFYEKHGKIISKSIAEAFSIQEAGDEGYYSMFTEVVEPSQIAGLPEAFFPSYVQEYVDKTIEIRVFYLNGKCYSMSIHSQRDEKTRVDFKKYNWEQPNRTVPYKLPDEVEGQIQLLMNALGLKTGSLDFIITDTGKIVFLEVNPVGQFGMVSYPCNYNLEQKVAQTLIQMNNEG